MASPAPLGPSIATDVSHDTVTTKAAVQEHAKAHGFAISTESSTPKQAFFICTKGVNTTQKARTP
jgi:hypothetical protein